MDAIRLSDTCNASTDICINMQISEVIERYLKMRSHFTRHRANLIVRCLQSLYER
ncbi:hypothetical protein [Iningainema tapete]|uniref:Uncharacterized protein n=1 Tax=Iningainema tapete BLCC-T55 TaxID=2748662 RepID=A0A8J6XVK0_9CYAN|nr:hypothetical protein [Iningainema tapete]MBD2778611.1 hypothetical protein [Iningainema tapete BLCC-T55]